MENPGTISRAVIEAWEDRIALLKIAVGTQPNRKKRGLFNLGGLILHGILKLLHLNLLFDSVKFHPA